MYVPELFPDWSDKTILIVEDEEIIRIFFDGALKVTKAKLLFAENGYEGIKIALSNESIDCILMDIRMPILDGYEAIKSIKAAKPGLPVIVQTAYALSHDRKKAYEAGCDEYISKPVRIEVLYSVLAKYLGNYTTGG
ncbi:MAG TPA: response regulator [Prolixibacteraceae bacterium]|nr:response regulator [Bacteroidales bacterium]HQN93622.1 response regulator [Prolixibacteraceae bacterium]